MGSDWLRSTGPAQAPLLQLLSPFLRDLNRSWGGLGAKMGLSFGCVKPEVTGGHLRGEVCQAQDPGRKTAVCSESSVGG